MIKVTHDKELFNKCIKTMLLEATSKEMAEDRDKRRMFLLTKPKIVKSASGTTEKLFHVREDVDGTIIPCNYCEVIKNKKGE